MAYIQTPADACNDNSEQPHIPIVTFNEGSIHKLLGIPEICLEVVLQDNCEDHLTCESASDQSLKPGAVGVRAGSSGAVKLVFEPVLLPKSAVRTLSSCYSEMSCIDMKAAQAVATTIQVPVNYVYQWFAYQNLRQLLVKQGMVPSRVKSEPIDCVVSSVEFSQQPRNLPARGSGSTETDATTSTEKDQQDSASSNNTTVGAENVVAMMKTEPSADEFLNNVRVMPRRKPGRPKRAADDVDEVYCSWLLENYANPNINEIASETLAAATGCSVNKVRGGVRKACVLYRASPQLLQRDLQLRYPTEQWTSERVQKIIGNWAEAGVLPETLDSPSTRQRKRVKQVTSPANPPVTRVRVREWLLQHCTDPTFDSVEEADQLAQECGVPRAALLRSLNACKKRYLADPDLLVSDLQQEMPDRKVDLAQVVEWMSRWCREPVRPAVTSASILNSELGVDVCRDWVLAHCKSATSALDLESLQQITGLPENNVSCLIRQIRAEYEKNPPLLLQHLQDIQPGFAWTLDQVMHRISQWKDGDNIGFGSAKAKGTIASASTLEVPVACTITTTPVTSNPSSATSMPPSTQELSGPPPVLRTDVGNDALQLPQSLEPAVSHAMRMITEIWTNAREVPRSTGSLIMRSIWDTEHLRPPWL